MSCYSSENSPTSGLMVMTASVHGLLRPTCNHSHKLLASGSMEIKTQWILVISIFHGIEIQKSGSKKL